MGASVNFFMFHGGTNFGFYNGANCQTAGQYEPTITSYDYDALLDEAGEPTAKYHAVREVLARYAETGNQEMPERTGRKAYGTVELNGYAGLFDRLAALSEPVHSAVPLTMEKIGQNYGFILYTTRITGPRPAEALHIQEVRDRAIVFVDGVFAGIIERGKEEQTVTFPVPAEGVRLDILVENMGRINYGPYLKDAKGITEGVRLGFQFLFDWTIHALPLEDLSALTFGSLPDSYDRKPAFYRGTFTARETADTFIDMFGWTKGVVFINGFNLGRYWDKGPQRTLYVPGPMLREGANEIVVFELHGCRQPAVVLTDTPVLDLETKG
jgi:beta-galactosidase